MSGSFVVAGGGVGRVVHVGDENYAAELTRKAKTKKRATSEMQNTIKRIIAVISILIIPIGILLFRSQISAQGMTRNEAIVATVAGIIGMIPEGLVLLTSISFILGVGRLAKSGHSCRRWKQSKHWHASTCSALTKPERSRPGNWKLQRCLALER